MTLRRCDSLPTRLREVPVSTEPKPKAQPNNIPDSSTVPNFNGNPDREQVVAAWNSLHSEVKKIKNGLPTQLELAEYHRSGGKETITHNFIPAQACNKSDVRRKITYGNRQVGVSSQHAEHNESFPVDTGQAATVECGSMAKRRTLLQRLLPWKTQECDCQERYIPKYRAAPKLRAEDLLCTCGASANKFPNKNKPQAERGRSKSVGYEAAREVTQFRRCASAGATVGAETAAALRARAALTLARRYYPEGGWGWTITVVGTIVQVLSHGLQLGGGTGAIACTAAVKYRVSPLYTHDMPRKRQRTTTKAAWTEEDLQSAKIAVEGGMSQRKAAIQYNLPFTTLRDRLKNKNMGNPRLGRKPVFTQQQETEIAEQVKLLGSLYYGLSVADLRKLVYKYAEHNNIKHNFDQNSKTAGLDWVHAFMRRNPSVSIRKAEATSLNRFSAFNKEEVTHFYDKLGELMEKHKFIPSNIYNADETGFTTVTDPGKVLAEKGQRRVGSVTSGERGNNITVMCAMSAAGNFIPPMFIFPRQRMTPLLKKDGPAGALYTNSKNGWINEDLFVIWLKHFAAFAKPTQESPVLLILDNHSSHISLQAFNFCKENHITMLSIPPHSSHRTQPLDVSFYGPLKAAYRHECNRHMKTHLLSKITPFEVAGLFNKAYIQVANISKAESGFRATGIYPLNPNVFTDQDFLAASLIAQESEQITENQDPNVQNLEDAQFDSMTITSGHTSPLAGPSNQCSEPVLKVACNQGLVNDQRAQVSFAAIATTPTIAPSSKPGLRKRKQHATVLTATPMKNILEDKEKKKIAKLNKAKDDDKSRPKKVVKEKKKKNIKQKSYKRKILQESSTESEDEEHLCDDNSDDEMNVDDENYNKCLICEEFGKNKELWYRCTICGLWAHAVCSGWDSPEGYICDLCVQK